MKKITVNKTRILTAAAALVAVFSLAGCGSNAVQEIPRSAETSRSEEATPETAAPEATATPAPTPEPAPAAHRQQAQTQEQQAQVSSSDPPARYSKHAFLGRAPPSLNCFVAVVSTVLGD